MSDSKAQLIAFFKTAGADERQAGILASQMIKRSAQLSKEHGWTEEKSMSYLLKLFTEGNDPKSFQ